MDLCLFYSTLAIKIPQQFDILKKNIASWALFFHKVSSFFKVSFVKETQP